MVTRIVSVRLIQNSLPGEPGFAAGRITAPAAFLFEVDHEAAIP
jgi:hypothetical protein